MRSYIDHGKKENLTLAIGRLARDSNLCQAVLNNDSRETEITQLELDAEQWVQLKAAAKFIASGHTSGDLRRFLRDVKIARDGLRVIE
jgi:hypothetical protein